MESGSEVSMGFIQTQQTKPQLTPKTPPMTFPLYREHFRQESSEEEEEAKGKGKDFRPLRPLTPEYIDVDPGKRTRGASLIQQPMEELIIQEPEVRDTVMRETPSQPPEPTQEELFYQQAARLGTNQKIKFYSKLQITGLRPKNQTELQFCEQYEFTHANQGNKTLVAAMI